MDVRRWVRRLGSLAMVAVVVAAAPAAWALPPAPAPQPWVARPAQELAALPAGISLEMLGSYDLALDNDWFDLVLERVPLDPRETLNGRDPDESGGGLGSATTAAQLSGAHVLFAEAGEIVVESESGERTLREGESTFEPPLPGNEALVDETGEPIASYDLRNETAACASLLRLSAWVLPGQMGGVPQAPSGPQRGCGSYELLFHDLARFPLPGPPPAETPVQIFLARLTWTEEAWLSSVPPLAYDGPVALVVESGELGLATGDRNAAGMAARFTPGGSMRIDAGVPFSAWAPPGTRVLVMGAAPAERGWSPLPPPREGEDGGVGSAAFAPGAVVVVADDRVRLRDAPSTSGGIAAVLERGARLTVTGPPERRADFAWYPVVDENGRAGFVAGDFLAAS